MLATNPRGCVPLRNSSMLATPSPSGSPSAPLAPAPLVAFNPNCASHALGRPSPSASPDTGLSWATTTAWPATVTVVSRGEPSALSAALTSIEPLPKPDTDDTVAHAVPDAAVHWQPAPAVICTALEPPEAPNATRDGDTAKVHAGTPACWIVAVAVPTVTVAERAVGPFAVTVSVTLPLPVPEAPCRRQRPGLVRRHRPGAAGRRGHAERHLTARGRHRLQRGRQRICAADAGLRDGQDLREPGARDREGTRARCRRRVLCHVDEDGAGVLAADAHDRAARGRHGHPGLRGGHAPRARGGDVDERRAAGSRDAQRGGLCRHGVRAVGLGHGQRERLPRLRIGVVAHRHGDVCRAGPRPEGHDRQGARCPASREHEGRRGVVHHRGVRRGRAQRQSAEIVVHVANRERDGRGWAVLRGRLRTDRRQRRRVVDRCHLERERAQRLRGAIRGPQGDGRHARPIHGGCQCDATTRPTQRGEHDAGERHDAHIG